LRLLPFQFPEMKLQRTTALPAGANCQERAMQRRRFKPTLTLDERLLQQAEQ
jgi:hypothetical protein